MTWIPTVLGLHLGAAENPKGSPPVPSGGRDAFQAGESLGSWNVSLWPMPIMR